MIDYSAEVTAAFVSKHSDGSNLTSTRRMNLRYETAKFLLTNRFSHLVDELDAKAAAQHKAGLDEWGLVFGSVSEATDISTYVSLLFRTSSTHRYFDRARDTLFDAVHPLLQAIGRYAGCYVSLIAGSPKTDDEKGFFTA
jgi:hypothetical protein